MATITRFEDLKCWQGAREIAGDIYAMTRSGEFSRDYGLKDQIQRAVVSISSNIAEGFERDSSLELQQFLGYAKGSAGEVRSQLYVALDLGYVGQKEFDFVVEKIKVVAGQISRFRASIRNASFKGLRYKSQSPKPET